MTALQRAFGLAAAIAITAACGGSAAPAASPTPATAGAKVAVDVQGFAFPATLEVAKGTTVTWTNKDSTKHTVTSGTRPNTDGRFDGQLEPGGTFSFTFAEAGTYTYYCSLHRSMNATITVK